jgi:hypothetical protein
MWLALVFLTGLAMDARPPVPDGTITGVVVRATDHAPVPRAEVVLRSRVGGQLLPVAETATDDGGRFQFLHLPADDANVYLPGANRGGIHYPGPTVRLSSRQPCAKVTLAVYDAVTFPNPLVVRQHTITLSPEQGVLRVTESMLIDNPAAACYVGPPAGENVDPVTLQLAIPADFAQVTFASEFFGRRFSLINGRLVTGVPWPPGQRELKFSYSLATTKQHYIWQRPLDLPSEQVQVTVRGEPSQPVARSLDSAARKGGGSLLKKGDWLRTDLRNLARNDHREVPVPLFQQVDSEIAFESGQRTLPAGYVLRVELDHIPFTLMAYAPWAATALLLGLLSVTCLPVACRAGRTPSTALSPKDCRKKIAAAA